MKTVVVKCSKCHHPLQLIVGDDEEVEEAWHVACPKEEQLPLFATYSQPSLAETIRRN